ncbi:MAG: SGNH/GDSL hydrolase family protein [Candidatus Krumholzibacteriia bacterium]
MRAACALVILAFLAAMTALAGCGPRRPDTAPLAAYPDPVRLAAEVDAFAAADSLAPPPPGGLLCIGSSSLRMWHPTLARDLAPHQVVPRGFGGSTMLDVLHFAPRLVLPYRPAGILLYSGDNDIDFGATPEEFLAVFTRFVALVRTELPRARFYVMSIKPSPARWAKWPAMARANALLQEACGRDSFMHYVDVATPMLGADGQPRRELFLPDMLHLNGAGYELWARVVRESLAGAPLPVKAAAGLTTSPTR